MLPNPIKRFVDAFSKLPSIGPRQATRLAFYIAGLGKNRIKEIADAVAGLADLTTCARCFRTHVGGGKLCAICADPTRDKSTIAIVEKETDLLSLEKAKKFNGWYFLMGELRKTGELEPEQKMRLTSLKEFIQKELRGKAQEIILAISPTVYGDLNAALLKKELEPLAEKITRLGRGIPTGGEIEFADEETLGNALDNRS
ncbi:MAG: toprim domain-containing protein [Patescibacteria group bacterium]|nr:toprim domain-containing protein [Patescibacteria group bacterium]